MMEGSKIEKINEDIEELKKMFEEIIKEAESLPEIVVRGGFCYAIAFFLKEIIKNIYQNFLES